MFMESLFSKDELMYQLTELRNKRDLAQKNRVASLEMSDLEMKIENVEGKLDRLF